MIGVTVGVVRALGMLVWQGRRRARRARPGPTATRLVRAVSAPMRVGSPVCARLELAARDGLRKAKQRLWRMSDTGRQD